MKAARVPQFGPPSVITNVDLPRPEPAAGQLLVHVKAAGVGNGTHWFVRTSYPTNICPLFLVTS
jgi:NADPH:quinone reductase-like Zn-dependent oxidoreductase